jgi:hypothetical protein
MKSFVVPDAVARHLGGHSASASPARMLLYMLEDGQAPWLYFQRYCGSAAALLFRLTIAAGSALRIAVMGVARAVRPTKASPAFNRARALLEWSFTAPEKLAERVDARFAKAVGP